MKANYVPAKVMKQKCDEIYEAAIDCIHMNLVLFLSVIHDELGIGAIRMQRVVDEVERRSTRLRELAETVSVEYTDEEIKRRWDNLLPSERLRAMTYMLTETSVPKEIRDFYLAKSATLDEVNRASKHRERARTTVSVAEATRVAATMREFQGYMRSKEGNV